MKYLKYFTNASDYQAFKESEDYILPNVSYVENSDVVMYGPYVEPASPNVVCVYNITDISQDTMLMGSYGLSAFDSMIVDGIETDVDQYYQFDRTGLHTVEFVLSDPTILTEHAFYDYGRNIPLISISLPSSITSLNQGVTHRCDMLVEYICHSMTQPYWTYNGNQIGLNNNNGVFKYPKGADYSGVVEYINQNYPNWTCVEF